MQHRSAGESGEVIGHLSPSRLIKLGDLTPQPWKNGGGITREVAIHPSHAQISKLDFDWRVSIAQVDASGPFSQFPGFDRKLVVWKGPGIKINGTDYARLSPFEFQGETPIQADLIGSPISDFGVIFKRGERTCDMSTRKLAEESETEIPHAKGDIFILCVSGELRIEGFYLNPGDVYHLAGPAAVRVKAFERSEIVVAIIR